jgi:hypothetical protein
MERDLLTDRTEKGTNKFYVSDSIELFEENARHFLRSEVVGDVFSSNE